MSRAAAPRRRARGPARLAAALILGLALALALGPAGRAQGLFQLDIVSGQGRHPFTVELAVDSAVRGKGLMFRRRLAADAGMLFDFGAETAVSMWMRNTYIPLDMLFADAGGVVHTIAERTEPFSEAIISPGRPSRYVLEVPGGTAERLGLKPGARLEPLPQG
jgi:hypothetical protein